MQLRLNALRCLRTILPLALLLAVVTAAHACPGCKDALAANDPEHQNIVRGYFWSILFMMGTPYLVLGSFCGYLYLLVRRARAAKEASEAAQVPAEAMLDSQEEPQSYYFESAEVSEEFAEPLEV